MQVQLLLGALTTRPVRLTAGCETLILAIRVQLSYGSLTDCRCGRCPTDFHKVCRPARYRDLQHCGWASAHRSLISSDRRVRPPDPPFLIVKSEGRRVKVETTGYANRQSDEVESLVNLWVRRPPRSLTIAWSSGKDAWVTTRRSMVRFRAPTDRLVGDHFNKWSVGVLAAHVCGKDGGPTFGRCPVRFPDGPLETRDAGLTGRRLACTQVIGVRLPGAPLTGSWSNGKTPLWHGGDRGSIPRDSTR